MSVRRACRYCLSLSTPIFASSSSSTSSFRAITTIGPSSRPNFTKRSIHSSPIFLERNQPRSHRSQIIAEDFTDEVDDSEVHQEIDDIEEDFQEREPFSLVNEDEDERDPLHRRGRRRWDAVEDEQGEFVEEGDELPFGLKVLPKKKVFDLTEEGDENFDDFAKELLRRKKVTEAKRRQRGGGFVDHMRVLVRGGKGGSGCAAFAQELSGRPSGGRGGSGGAVYLKTNPHLTSLNSVKSRYFGPSGSHGSGSVMHGKGGEDIFIEVPVGTVVREVRRTGEGEAILKKEQEEEIEPAERQRRRWERWFIRHPSLGLPGMIEEDEEWTKEFKKAERLLREIKRWHPLTPDFERSPPIVLDIAEPLEEPILLSAGGAGGLGNVFFAAQSEGNYKTSRIASTGAMPYTSMFEFELKLLADVGFVGFPNAGKSTLLRGLTGRRAEVAEYEFTTLNPQVGVVIVYENGSWEGQREEGEVVEETWRERQAYAGGLIPRRPGGARQEDKHEVLRFTISDNPGILPLASENVGLGHSFLRSIERSLAIAYVVDLSRKRPQRDLKVLRDELEAYKPDLSRRGGLVILTKADEVDEETGRQKIEAVREMIEQMDPNGEIEVVVLSGKYGLGMKGLVEVLARKVTAARIVAENEKVERKKIAEQEKTAKRMKYNDERAREGLI
ncbi:hypothetical protein BCR39DRAFT_513655 [Naematelia encephala]|uniref:P-loop containing nucleoside triphosphate hydrolase protein n=1 Tax=Naematelia encephala TaxID=71784 RepID=A0A1Y2BIJ9_9TREE|nr:hypothetical protein BCR39DRAFT_513655 [Naematelia encephala]